MDVYVENLQNIKTIVLGKTFTTNKDQKIYCKQELTNLNDFNVCKISKNYI